MARETTRRVRRGSGHLYRPKRKGPDGIQRESSIWWMVYYKNGKRIAEGTGTRNKPKASRLLNDRMGRVDRGEPVELRNLTFADLEKLIRDDYISEGNRSTGRLEASLKHLREHFGDRLAHQIDDAAIRGYVAARMREPSHQGTGAARATINAELAALRRAFNLAKVSYKPTIRTPNPKNAREGFLSRDGLEAICRLLPAHLQAVMKAAFLTGWRAQSELLTREWRHVDFAAGWLRLEASETKNGEARKFPLDTLPELREILEQQRAKAELVQKASGKIINWVFFHKDGRQIKDYRGAWASACGKAGYGGQLVHDLRRSAVRSLEAAGVSRSAAMQLTGHLTESVYRRYAVVDQNALREGARKLAEYHARERERLASEGPKVLTLPTAQEREASQAR